MASDLHVIATDASSAQIDDVVATLDHLERCWSRFISTSDISRINVMAGGRLAVDDSTLTLLAAMVEGCQITEGRYDPTVMRALVALGYASSRVDPSRTTLLSGHVSPPATLQTLDLHPSSGMVIVPEGLALDPGGIGKGLAADLAVAQLMANGARGALVSIGGDIAMAGDAADDAGWLVDVEHPEPMDGILCSLAVSGGGVATSSTRSRRWILDGVDRHHQIDPKTSKPSTTDLAMVTIIARSGWHAEVHATAAIGLGSTRVLEYVALHRLSGIAVTDKGDVLVSADLAGVEMRVRAGTG